jgi:hypothetical protein
MDEIRQTLQQRFGWKVPSDFQEKELNGLIQTGEEICDAIERWLPGINGDAWVRQFLGKSVFHLGGLPQKVVSLANGGMKISLVFFNFHVWLDPSTFNSIRPTQWITHELGHVLDNTFHSGAIWWGGGPSDDLQWALNGRPSGLRWNNGKAMKESLPQNATWTHHNQRRKPDYGDNSTADYFAETWMYSIYRPEVIPPMARDWFLDWIRDQSLLLTD